MKYLIIAIVFLGLTGCSMWDSVQPEPCKDKKFISKYLCKKKNG